MPEHDERVRAAWDVTMGLFDRWPEEIPAISFQILKDCDSSVGFPSWRRQNLHTPFNQALIRIFEVIDPEEEAHSASKLSTDDRRLRFAIRAR